MRHQNTDSRPDTETGDNIGGEVSEVAVAPVAYPEGGHGGGPVDEPFLIAQLGVVVAVHLGGKESTDGRTGRMPAEKGSASLAFDAIFDGKFFVINIGAKAGNAVGTERAHGPHIGGEGEGQEVHRIDIGPVAPDLFIEK